MDLLISFLISTMSFQLADYNKKDNDKIGTWLYRISGIIWGIGGFIEFATYIQ